MQTAINMCPRWEAATVSSMFQQILNSCLLPLPAPASPAPARGGAGSCWAQSAVWRAGSDVDLSLLDLTASLRRKVFDLLLRLQIKHDVSQLLLQLSDRHVLQIACRKTPECNNENFCIKMSKNNETFVVYFVGLCAYSIINVSNNVHTQRLFNFTRGNRVFHLVTGHNLQVNVWRDIREWRKKSAN